MNSRSTRRLVTESGIAADLRRLGLRRGSRVIVHTSLKSIGWVCGGPLAVIDALMRVVGRAGTIVMPTQTTVNSDPAGWRNPPVPRRWWPVIRRSMPAFDPRRTPSAHVGAIPETFRSLPGVMRSAHPQVSFSAWGREARRIIRGHMPAVSLSDRSPLGHLYDLDALVLLVGVGHDANTALHLAEARSGMMRAEWAAAAVRRSGGRTWLRWRELESREELFPALGRSFERAHGVRAGRIGAAETRLMPMRPLVDFGAAWLRKRLGRRR